ncbi:MAG TPA: hypothetical protein K8W06_01530 [Limosilactobacillus coleohominis]|nr:hypothetical protein [Limosilactobacillus coleohominis]
MAEVRKITEMLWRVLSNLSIDDDNNKDNQIFVNVKSGLDKIQRFPIAKSELITFVNKQVGTFNYSNGVYFSSSHVEYTVLARQKSKPFLAPFAWGEDIVFGGPTRYKYSLSQVSLGLFFKFLEAIDLDDNFIVQNIFTNSFYMGVFSNSGKAIDLMDNEINLYNVIDSLLRRSVKQYLMAIKIEPVDSENTNEIADNINDYKKMAEAAMFNINLAKFHGFSLRHLEKPLIAITSSNNMNNLNGELMESPHMIYNHDMLDIYTAGNWHDDPLVQFLNYYQVVEYLFNYVPDELLFKKVQSEIANPKFSYTNKNDILELSRLISKLNTKNEREVNSLEMVLSRYVEYSDLKKSLSDESISYYYDKVPPFLEGISNLNGIKFSINNLKESDKVYGKMARRLYAIRNSLVHNKEGESHFNPLIDDEYLEKEIPLMKAIAETVIIKYGTTIE